MIVRDSNDKTSTPPALDTRDVEKRLLELVPGCEISTDDSSLNLANTATFATSVRSSILVRPNSVDHIVKVVKFASTHHLKIYTMSQGRNWGFGSRVPVEPVTILLDLSRMNRILQYDSRHGTLRVEPGVTFADVSRFLADAGRLHFISTIGGSPRASVVGNVLERGDGSGPLWDRALHTCTFEVVLADGTVIDTGYGNRKESRIAHVSRDGVGPGVQDLFLQSNLGIVTKMTLLLHRTPKNFRSYWFRLAEHGDLDITLERLRVLLQRGVATGPIVFWNDYKQTVANIQYPWSMVDNTTPLDRTKLRRISNAYCAWLGFGGIYVDHPVISALSQHEISSALKQSLGNSVTFSSLSSHEIKLFRWLDTLPFSRFDHASLLRQWEMNPLLGSVNDSGAKTLYWRKRHPPPEKMDPDRDDCGVIWNAFEAPLEGRVIVDLLQRLDARVLGHGFEPIVSFAVVNDRRAKFFLQLIYDRSEQGEDDRAWACHADVFAFLEDQGFNHTRVDTRQMAEMRMRARNTTLRDRIAKALDPAATFSPGRYEF